jgi:hypothetical protein
LGILYFEARHPPLGVYFPPPPDTKAGGEQLFLTRDPATTLTPSEQGIYKTKGFEQDASWIAMSTP